MLKSPEQFNPQSDSDQTIKERTDKQDEAFAKAENISDWNLKQDALLKLAKDGNGKAMDLLGDMLNKRLSMGLLFIDLLYEGRNIFKEYVQLIINSGNYTEALKLIDKYEHQIDSNEIRKNYSSYAYSESLEKLQQTSPDVDLLIYMAERGQDDMWIQAINKACRKNNHIGEGRDDTCIWYRENALFKIALAAARIEKNDIVESVASKISRNFSHNLNISLAKQGFEPAWEWLIDSIDTREAKDIILGKEYNKYLLDLRDLAEKLKRQDILERIPPREPNTNYFGQKK